MFFDNYKFLRYLFLADFSFLCYCEQMDLLIYELKKLGLKEKEAKVYLAGLELGPASIIQLTKAAGITRPTTYEIVSTLEKRKLFTSVEANKKRQFVAQSPDVLLGILRMEKRTLEEREREFLRIISQLESLFSPAASGVRMYSGMEGLKALEEKITTATAKKIFLITARKRKTHTVLIKQLEKRMGIISLQEKTLKETPAEIWIMPNRVVAIARHRTEGFLFENPFLVSLFSFLFRNLRYELINLSKK